MKFTRGHFRLRIPKFLHRPRPARKRRERFWDRVLSLAGMVTLFLFALGIFANPRCLTSPEASSPPASEEQTEWYEVFFTAPSFPGDPDLHRGSVMDSLIAAINSAQQALDVAVYDMDLLPVTEALLRARDRGVRVRVVTETDNADTKAIARLRAGGIPVVTDEREGYMHNKFMVIDGDRVWTGSMNFTYHDVYQNDNNAVLIHSSDLARNYSTKFSAMFERRAFGPARTSGDTVPRLTVRGIRMENYFAPEDPTIEAIQQVIRGARERIVWMAFVFTHPRIADVLIERARAGVKIHGVLERAGAEAPASQFRRLRQAGIDVLKDGNPYNMHHKVLVIDRRIVLFGSYNFSRNAAQDNDENLLIVADPEMALRFEAEFARIYDQALNPPRVGWLTSESVFAPQ